MLKNVVGSDGVFIVAKRDALVTELSERVPFEHTGPSHEWTGSVAGALWQLARA